MLSIGQWFKVENLYACKSYFVLTLKWKDKNSSNRSFTGSLWHETESKRDDVYWQSEETRLHRSDIPGRGTLKGFLWLVNYWYMFLSLTLFMLLRTVLM